MFHTIVKYGVIAGLVVGGFMFATFLGFDGLPPMKYGMAIGYATMLIALGAVFVGIRRHRDVDRGGVIGFWAAFGIGLGISVVAGLFYVVAWEAVQAVTGLDFATSYSQAMLDSARAQGAGAEALANQFAANLNAGVVRPRWRVPDQVGRGRLLPGLAGGVLAVGFAR